VPGRYAKYLDRHIVPQNHFESLASGGGDHGTIKFLFAGERSRRLLLLRAMLDAAAEVADACGPLPGIETAWRALIFMQSHAPAEFDDILMQPQIGTWLAHCLRRLNRIDRGRIPLWVDIGYVFNFVLAVAVRSGIEFSTSVPHRAGSVMIPTMGLVQLAEGADFGIVEARVFTDHIRVRTKLHVLDVELPTKSDAHGWWGLRRLSARAEETELGIWLDDIDPFRDLSEPIPPERLSDGHARQWQLLLDGAYAILAHDNPSLAAAMAVGYLSVVPLPPAGDLPVRSASSGDCFGSALISMPPDPTTLAATLVHEFQHIKLGGLLHLLTLCHDDERLRFYAPWRDDPRPLRGMMQGAYAYLGVTEFWRARRRSDDVPTRDLSEFEFAFWRDQTSQAIELLRADAGLTGAGRRFTAGMAARMRTWSIEQVSPQVAAAARIAADDHRAGWRIRHLRPDPGYVAELADALRQGSAANMSESPAPRIVPDPDATWSHKRIGLCRLRFADPIAYAARTVARESGPPTFLAADAALLSGDHDHAAEAYVGLLKINPEQPDAWTGLVLALVATGGAARRLLGYPELLPAIHAELRAGGAAPDPRMIAEWLMTPPEDVVS
jgi:HEXXH motif-containing protein